MSFPNLSSTLKSNHYLHRLCSIIGGRWVLLYNVQTLQYNLKTILAARARCDYRTICGGNKTLTRQNV